MTGAQAADTYKRIANKPRLNELSGDRSDEKAALRAVRQVYFAEAGGFTDCPSYDRYRLSAGGVIEGPAIVEEMDSTTVIHPGFPGFRGEVDRYGNLRIGTGWRAGAPWSTYRSATPDSFGGASGPDGGSGLSGAVRIRTPCSAPGSGTPRASLEPRGYELRAPPPAPARYRHPLEPRGYGTALPLRPG